VTALCIFDLHVVFKNIETQSAFTQTQQWLPFVLLSSYKTFHTAVNNITFLKSPYKLADIVDRNLTKYGIYDKFSKKSPNTNFKKVRPVGASMIYED